MTKLACILVVVAVIFALSALSCKNDVSGPDGNTNNLIKNPSFENGDTWSFKYWNLSDTLPDTAAMFSEDVPPTGGAWSLELQPSWVPSEGFARYYIPGEAQRAAYRLTIWAKATSNWQNGYIALGVLSLGQWTVHKQTAVTSGVWEPYSLEDTVRLYPQDTLVVHLSAGSAEVSSGFVLFDEAFLEKR